MSSYLAATSVKSQELSAKVIRCGCTLEQRLEKGWHGYMNEPCNNPKEIEDLGVIAYRNANPLKTLWWKMKQLFNR